MQALGDEDKDNIHQTIDDEVLNRQDIVFRSTRVEARRRPEGGGRADFGGDDAAAEVRPRRQRRRGGGGHRDVTQTDFGMKPYSALWGALKVLDEVEVALEGRIEAG